MARKKKPKKSQDSTVAEAIDRVTWDYCPGDPGDSLLRPTGDFFRNFPWEGKPAKSTDPSKPVDNETESNED